MSDPDEGWTVPPLPPPAKTDVAQAKRTLASLIARAARPRRVESDFAPLGQVVDAETTRRQK